MKCSMKKICIIDIESGPYNMDDSGRAEHKYV
jgi:hypothetical protein